MLWRTLRGRLMLSLSAVFLLALGASALIDTSHQETHADIVHTLDREPFQDGVVLALFSVPALALIWLISSWSLRPLTRASAEAERAGPHARGARLSRDGLPAEVTPLVDAVNGALDRMSDAFEAERRFTENAAHELRTPLAVLGLRLQRARKFASPLGTAIEWPEIDRDLARMNRLVSQLLDLARKENAARAGKDADWAPVNLARVARQAAAAIFPLVEAQHRALLVELPDSLMIGGRAEDLCDAVRNMIENAVMHGRGTITLAGSIDAGQAVLIVSDEGPGIGEDVREAVFERFTKGSASDGSGLGLAIVRQVARAHGGEAWVPATSGHVRFSVPRLVVKAGGCGSHPPGLA